MQLTAIKKFPIQGPLFIEMAGHDDARGTFVELYNQTDLIDHIGERFTQDNLSFSKKNVIRGLHYQVTFPQGKLIYCLQGVIFDVALDMRWGSPTFGAYVGVTLDARYNQAFYIPPGFAHGFAVASASDAMVWYKCTHGYRKACDRAISWKDSPITLPKDFITEKAVVSAKDLAAPPLTAEMAIRL
ncbi:MAG: dTDP-4-dehydrorhamnose 3,5-epimerase [Amoebophilaceae bacterium]|nr:dTDP-4-dehydrorhamnose 3,5-epimerase [Amoebophilaceae bacterium]